MSSELRNAVLLYRVISVIFQTFAYGIYLCLIPISIYVMRAKGLRARSRQFLFVMTMFMFALSTLYWILSLAVTFLVFRAWFSNLDPNTHQPPNWLPMFSAIVLLNYILTDGVVVWRAWVLCPDQSKAILMVPVVTLVINMLIYLTMISVRAALYVVPEGVPSHHSLARAIDISQVSNLVFSLLTNVLATSIIAHKAWAFRQSLEEGFGCAGTRGSKILVLLIESGMLYIVIGISVLVSIVIRLPFGTLGDIFMPVAVQLAGMYPIIVLLLVDQDRSLNSTSYYSSGSVATVSAGRTSNMEPMSFAPGPVLASNGQHPLEKTRLRNDSAQFSFGSVTDPSGLDPSRGGDPSIKEKSNVI